MNKNHARNFMYAIIVNSVLTIATALFLLFRFY